MEAGQWMERLAGWLVVPVHAGSQHQPTLTGHDTLELRGVWTCQPARAARPPYGRQTSHDDTTAK